VTASGSAGYTHCAGVDEEESDDEEAKEELDIAKLQKDLTSQKGRKYKEKVINRTLASARAQSRTALLRRESAGVIRRRLGCDCVCITKLREPYCRSQSVPVGPLSA
jgi:hypothetical protein